MDGRQILQTLQSLLQLFLPVLRTAAEFLFNELV